MQTIHVSAELPRPFTGARTRDNRYSRPTVGFRRERVVINDDLLNLILRRQPAANESVDEKVVRDPAAPDIPASCTRYATRSSSLSGKSAS